MSSFKVVTVTLSSAVATSGTFTVTYPTGTDAAWFISGVAHTLQALGNTFTAPADFRISSFGADAATVTWLNATTLPAGTVLYVQLNIPGPETYRKRSPVVDDNLRPVFPYRLILGTPVVADVNGVCEAQSDTGAHTLTLDGALVTGGVAVMDVPRNLVADSGGADSAVLTITGTDVDGNTLVENITLNGTTAVPGKKAFKTVTSVTSSATIANGAFLGTGDVLGLPVYIGSTSDVVGELEDGATATGGTVVEGLAPNTKSTATTADVRGTYDPNSAADGSKAFELLVLLSDPEYAGNPQFAG